MGGGFVNVGKGQFFPAIPEQKDSKIKQEMETEAVPDPDALDSDALISAHERRLKEATDLVVAQGEKQIQQFSGDYLLRQLCSTSDDQVRQLATEVATDSMPQLSRIHTQFAVIVEERDRLYSLVPLFLYNWKNALLLLKINDLKAQIAAAEPEQQPVLISELQKLYNVRHKLAAVIGDRVVNPK